MKTKLWIAAGLLLLASTAQAQEKVLGRGTHEIEPSFALSRNFGRTTAQITASYGYFVTDWLKPEVSASLFLAKGGNAGTLAVGPIFYYDRGTALVPYAGAKIGFGKGSFDGHDTPTSLIIAPKVGALYMLTKNVGLDAHFEYQYWTGDNGSNHFILPVGFAIFF